MTYVLLPNAGQSLGQTRAQIRTNFQIIQTAFAVDHVDFNNIDAGKHKIIHFVTQAGNPVAVAGVGQLYTKTITGDQQLFYESGGGVVSKLSPMPILPVAAVNFQGRSPANGPCVLNYQTNVSNVQRIAKGFYRIDFATALPTANYYPTAIARRSLSVDASVSQLAGGSSLTVNNFTVNFLDSSLNDVDPQIGIVMVFQ